MKASETEFKKIIEGTTQFFVPHYQRPYSWVLKQWQQIWEDLVSLVDERAASAPEAAKPTHFIGSMVTIPGVSVPQGVAKYVLIDGQQRITTLMILLAALRDLAREKGDGRRAEMVHNLYLTNQYQEGLEHYKLLPTQGDDPINSDRTAFIRILSPEQGPKIAEHRATGAYEFFYKKLRQSSPSPEVLIEAVTTGFVIVSIVLDRDGRVGGWRGGHVRRVLVCVRGFPLRARLGFAVTPFPVPRPSNRTCGSPASGSHPGPRDFALGWS